MVGDVFAEFAALASRYPVGPDSEDHENAYFLKVDTRGLPATLPSGWTLLRERRTSAALLAVARSALEWRSFEACDAEKGQCTSACALMSGNMYPVCATCVKGAQRRRTGHSPARAAGAAASRRPRVRSWSIGG